MESKFDYVINLAEYLLNEKILNKYTFVLNDNINNTKFTIIVTDEVSVIVNLDTAYWYLQGMVDAHNKLSKNDD